jgi:hypothetical protein
MDLGNAFLALQALADLPEYRDRPLPDERLPREHVAAWTAHFTRYCAERARNGLFIEVASPTYGKYLMPELVNLYDFANDATLRDHMERLLHLTWADWAIEQLDGVRGGGKARCYQGNYSRNGSADSWRWMGNILLGLDDWTEPGRFNHQIHGYAYVLATSRYELPEIVRDLALSPDDRGEYAYVSRRPGRMTPCAALPPLGGHGCWYAMHGPDSQLLRYTWCTPDHIMGCFMVDPTLATNFQVDPEKPDEVAASYAAISSQNRWQGIIFDTDPGARIFPQCIGNVDKNRPGVTTTYHQQVAVQHENVLIVQMNRAAPKNTAMRVYFAPGMKERLIVREGWFLLQEGDSYVGVRAVAPIDGNTPCETAWDNGLFLRNAEPYAPLVFVTGRTKRFPDLAAFENYLNTHECRITDGTLRYSFQDSAQNRVELALDINEPRVPEINNTPINLAPSKTYNSPYLHSDSKSVTISFRDMKQILLLPPNTHPGT